MISHSYGSWSETGRNSTEKDTISGSTRTVKVTTVIDYRRLVKQYKDGALDDQWYEYDSNSSTLTKDYKWVSTDWVMTSYDGASSVLSGAARQEYENDFGQMTIYDATGDQPKSTLVRYGAETDGGAVSNDVTPQEKLKAAGFSDSVIENVPDLHLLLNDDPETLAFNIRNLNNMYSRIESGEAARDDRTIRIAGTGLVIAGGGAVAAGVIVVAGPTVVAAMSSPTAATVATYVANNGDDLVDAIDSCTSPGGTPVEAIQCGVAVSNIVAPGDQPSAKVHSVYKDGTTVSTSPGKIKGPDPEAGGAPHTVLKWDKENDRVYKAREYAEGEVPVREIHFTAPVSKSGNIWDPDSHELPHQHPVELNNPQKPQAGVRLGKAERVPEFDYEL